MGMGMTGLNVQVQLTEALQETVQLEEGRDRRKPQARKPRYQFHIERCQQRLSEPPEKRHGIRG